MHGGSGLENQWCAVRSRSFWGKSPYGGTSNMCANGDRLKHAQPHVPVKASLHLLLPMEWHRDGAVMSRWGGKWVDFQA